MNSSGSRILLLAATIGLAACSSQKNALVKPAGEGRQTAATVVPKRQPQVSPLRRKIVPLLEKKQYQQAIELMNGKNREGLEKEYILALNGLLESGNDAFSAGDYATAGRVFKGGLTAYPVEPPLQDRVSHDPKRIRTLLEVCLNRMMEQGIEEYRRGRLENAINIWKGLLAIRPGHQEAKKALETTTVQLQALQDMKNE